MSKRSISTLCVLVGFGAAHGAFAQTQAPSDAASARPSDAAETRQLDDVVVSATKHITSLQKTPISAEVISAQEMSDDHAISLESFQDGSVPSLRVAPFFARSSALAIGMRGIGATGDANQPARDQGVGVYVDGVYMGRAQGLGAALYDVDRIEVLKGPQGTLFGRNTEGGAISIITKQPDGEFHLDTDFGVSNYDGYDAGVHLSTPSVGDFSFKVDGVVSSRGGTVNNPMQGQPDFNSYDKKGLRLAARWAVSENFSATYAFDVSRDDTTPYYVQSIASGPYHKPPVFLEQPERADSAGIGVFSQDSVGKTSGSSLVLDWELGDDLQLKSISSYRALTQTQFDNGEGEATAAFISPAYTPTWDRYSLAWVQQHQYSEELQAIGNTRTIQYAAGAFYYFEAVNDDAQTPALYDWNADGSYVLSPLITLPMNFSAWPLDRRNHDETRSLGLFAQGTWTPASLDRFHLTLGGRLTSDHKDGTLLAAQVNTQSATALSTVCLVGIAPGCALGPVSFDKSWQHFDPMLDLAWDFSRDTMGYAKWSTGFKDGGVNGRSLTYTPFNPEKVSALEVGLKTQFWDDRARFNVALFDEKLKDMQVDFTQQLPVGGTNRGSLETVNADTDVTSKGVEADLTLRLTDNLRMTMSYAYTDMGTLQAKNPFLANVEQTTYPLYTPKNAGNVAFDYSVPVGHVALRAHLDANYSGGYYTAANDPTLSDKGLIVNARVAVADVKLGRDATAEFALWSRNLLNEAHAFLKSGIGAATIGSYAIFNDPRTFGIEARLNY